MLATSGKGERKISTYDFCELEVFSRQQVEILNSLYSHLQPAIGGIDFKEILDWTLRRYIRERKIEGAALKVIKGGPEGGGTATEGLLKGKFDLVKDVITIGRHPDNDVCIPDRRVSSRHARIVRAEDSYFLSDLGSANGTYLNDVKLGEGERRQLRSGDLISIVDYVLEFEVKTREAPIADIDLKVSGVTAISSDDFIRSVVDPTVVAVIGLEPMGKKGALELDLNFCHAIIDRLVGGRAGPLNLLRPLTDIEIGLLEFLLLKFLHRLGQELERSSSVVLRLKRVSSSSAALRGMADQGTRMILISVLLLVGDKAGYAKLCLPEVSPETAFAPSLEHLRGELSKVWRNKVILHFEVGEADLTMAEIRQLEPGDIILLDKSHAWPVNGVFEGQVILRVNRGENAGLYGKIIACEHEGQDEVLKIEIANIFKKAEEVELTKGEEETLDEFKEEGQAGEHLDDTEVGEIAEEDQGAAPEEDNLAETEPLLDDVSVTVKVEIGRKEMTVKELVQLKVGQVIELNRSPAEPVDLTIGGKLIGKGQLVRIDGELGVKVVSLTLRKKR